MPTSSLNLFDMLLHLPTNSRHSITWQPCADILRADNEWLVKVELAGIRSEDIQLQARGRQLVLSGVRRDLSPPCRQTSEMMEIAYNRFERRFEFSTTIDATAIHTDYRDGILYIHLRTVGER